MGAFVLIDSQGIVSGQQLRNAISARSNFGLGFALTHIVIKSDESHRRKYIFDLAIADLTSPPHISIATLGVASYLLSWSTPKSSETSVQPTPAFEISVQPTPASEISVLPAPAWRAKPRCSHYL